MPRSTYYCDACKVHVCDNNKISHENGEKHKQKKTKIGNTFILQYTWKSCVLQASFFRYKIC